MSQVSSIFQQNSLTPNGLRPYSTVEIYGVVVHIESRKSYTDPTEFRVRCKKIEKSFNVSYKSYCAIRKDDYIYCACQVCPDGSLVALRLPFVQPPVDRHAILQCMMRSLKIGFGPVSALYRKLEKLAEGESKIIEFLSETAQQWNDTRNLELLYMFPNTDEDQIKKLLQWWHRERNLRRLYLFGLTKKEINACRMTTQEIYDRCISNPYSIPAIPIDKCDNIVEMQNKKISDDERERGAIVRVVWRNLHESGWTGTPSRFVAKQFPNVGSHIDILKEQYGVAAELFTVYLKFPHKVETFVAEYFETMVKRDKITYDTPLDTSISQPDGSEYTRISACTKREMSEDQMKAIQGALDHSVSIIKGGPGTGKCLDPNQKILMYDGSIKRNKDIKVGELLMGPDSKPRRVLSTCTGQDNMFMIVPDRGRSFTCNTPHILTLIGMSPYLVDTSVIYSKKGVSHLKAFLSKKDAIKFKESLIADIFDIPLNEYLELSDNIKENCYLFHVSVDFPYSDVSIDPYIVGCEAIENGIPDNYKINSKEVRKRVLDGICDVLDTPIIVDNTKLADDIEFLAHSLGYLVDRCGDELRLNQDTTVKFKVIPKGKGEYCGFELDGDGRFLLDDFLVTHNTSCLAEIVYNLELRDLSYAVCSFTGKAVSRIKEVTKKRNPSTMHRLISNTRKNYLDKRSTKFELEVPLMDYDYVIIDEVSMVTTELFYDFIIAYPNIKHLILIGDVNQLPPISWGSLYYQLLKSETIPTYSLTTNYRVYVANGERDGIVMNCNAMVSHDPDYPFEFVPTDNFSIIEGPVERVYDILKSCFTNRIKPRQIVVLCPYNKWLDPINQEFQKIFDEGRRYRVDSRGIKWMIEDIVMLIENDQEIGVYNGESGTVKDITDKALLVDFGDAGCHEFLFEPTYEERLNYDQGTSNTYYRRGLPVDEVLDGDEGDVERERTVKKLVHSYAMTIDKSQGSEWDFVILFIPEFNTGGFVNKNRIMTGISRAKRCCWNVVADVNLFNLAATKPPPFRCDNLGQRLNKLLPNIKPYTIRKPVYQSTEMLGDLPIMPEEYNMPDGYGFEYDMDDE